MQYLEQSTAGQVISLGQFLDSTDGDTEENGLTINAADIKLHKNGEAVLVNKNSGGATSVGNGVYVATLDATDTNKLGRLEIYVHVAGALSVKAVFQVLPSASYNALIVDGLNDIAATDIVTNGAIATTGGAVDTCTTNTDMRGTDNAATAAQVSGLNDIAATDIVSAGPITTLAGAVVNVDLVDTCTTNSDMRGTDSAATAVQVAALNDISVADILGGQLTEGYAADGAEPTLEQALMLIQQFLGESGIVGTQLTVRRLDGTTAAAVYTLDDDTSPTSKTRTA